MQEEFLQAIKDASREKRCVFLTFKNEPEATGYILYLLEMNKNGLIKMSDSDTQKLRYISEHNQWEDDNTVTVMITLTDRFNESHANSLIKQMHPALERVIAN